MDGGLTTGADGVVRCWWSGDDPLYVDYHDREWGRPTRDEREVPAHTAESTALSKVLESRGARFVGPTIVYAFMQSAGMVDDHLSGCHRAGS